MSEKFSKIWNRSIQPRKQRKFRYNAPLHIRQKFVSAHLLKELRKKYGIRSLNLKKGDKVRVMRGKFRKKIGKIERVDLKKSKVYITGIETVKREGTKSLLPFEPSNLLIIELNLDDKNRKKMLERKIKKGNKEDLNPNQIKDK